jgi:hypothetical protein
MIGHAALQAGRKISPMRPGGHAAQPGRRPAVGQSLLPWSPAKESVAPFRFRERFPRARSIGALRCHQVQIRCAQADADDVVRPQPEDLTITGPDRGLCAAKCPLLARRPVRCAGPFLGGSAPLPPKARAAHAGPLLEGGAGDRDGASVRARGRYAGRPR